MPFGKITSPSASPNRAQEQNLELNPTPYTRARLRATSERTETSCWQGFRTHMRSAKNTVVSALCCCTKTHSDDSDRFTELERLIEMANVPQFHQAEGVFRAVTSNELKTLLTKGRDEFFNRLKQCQDTGTFSCIEACALATAIKKELGNCSSKKERAAMFKLTGINKSQIPPFSLQFEPNKTTLESLNRKIQTPSITQLPPALQRVMPLLVNTLIAQEKLWRQDIATLTIPTRIDEGGIAALISPYVSPLHEKDRVLEQNQCALVAAMLERVILAELEAASPDTSGIREQRLQHRDQLLDLNAVHLNISASSSERPNFDNVVIPQTPEPPAQPAHSGTTRRRFNTRPNGRRSDSQRIKQKPQFSPK